MSSKETNISLRQRLKNQQCATVTEDYLCRDCTLRVIKEWLTQKLKEPKPNYPLNSKAKDFYDAKEVVLLELLEDLK
jgi:hypothetical protein